MTRIFISYCWAAESDCAFAREVFERLREYKQLKVSIDHGSENSIYQQDKHKFMEESCLRSTIVLVIGSKAYKEKADARDGSVGEETRHLATRHSKELSDNNRSSVILLLRENGGVPDYLQSSTYFDFTSTSTFDRAFGELTKTIRDHANEQPKTTGISSLTEYPKHFTRTDDLIKSVYRKSTKLVANRDRYARFELWVAENPTVLHILIVFEEVQLDRLVSAIKKSLLDASTSLETLIVLRADLGLSSALKTALDTNFSRVEILFFSIHEFIREYCPLSANRFSTKRYVVPYYLNQEISRKNGDNYVRVGGSKETYEFLRERIQSNTDASIHLLVADGGYGKSELCCKLFNSILNDTSSTSIPMLLSTRELVTQESKEAFRFSLTSHCVESLFDIYRAFVHASDSDKLVERRLFELYLLSGNLTLIIDGLDEIRSLAQEQFDRKKFMESVEKLNVELGRASIFLASRNHHFEDLDVGYENIETYTLGGFDEQHIKRYYEARFRNDAGKIRRSLRFVAEFKQNACVEVVSPFVIDLIGNECDANQDALDAGPTNLDEAAYPNNGDANDVIVFTFLKRECARQQLHDRNISPNVYFEFLRDVAVQWGALCTKEEFEISCNDAFGVDRAENLGETILGSPLLKYDKNTDTVRFSYDFLCDYFVAIFAMKRFLDGGLDHTDIRIYGKFAEGKANSAYGYILKYLLVQSLPTNACAKLISHLRQRYARSRPRKDLNQIARAISFVLHVYSDVLGRGASERDFSNELLSLFDDGEVISRLFIYGDFRKIDFSNNKYINCGFYAYDTFIDSNFEGATFSESKIDINSSGRVNPTISKQTFDATCDIGRLSSITQSTDTPKGTELKRFLEQFFVHGNFITLELDKLIFPHNFDESSSFFRIAVSQHVVFLNERRQVGITSACRPAVSSYLTNGVLDRKLNKILVAMP